VQVYVTAAVPRPAIVQVPRAEELLIVTPAVVTVFVMVPPAATATSVVNAQLFVVVVSTVHGPTTPETVWAPAALAVGTDRPAIMPNTATRAIASPNRPSLLACLNSISS